MPDSTTSDVESLHARVRDLEVSLAVEKNKTASLEAQLKNVKQHQVNNAAASEAEQEYILNTLQKKLDELKSEKAELQKAVEKEQDYLSNTLQKKLKDILKEKVDLENELEMEQEYVVNKLTKQLDVVKREKEELESKLATNSSQLISKLYETVEKLNEAAKHFSGSHGPNESANDERIRLSLPDLASHMAAEIEQLHLKKEEVEQEQETYRKKNAELEKHLKHLEDENFVLQQKIQREKEKSFSLNSDRARLELELENDIERQFNHGDLLDVARRLSRSNSRRSSFSSSIDGVDVAEEVMHGGPRTRTPSHSGSHTGSLAIPPTP